MNLATLSLLVDIIEAGNLSKAAARLGVSRASVSQRLNQLERELDQQLLRRTTRQIEPTELGWKLYEHGRAMRKELLAASEAVSTLGQGLQGTVRLSVPSGYGQLTMSAWLTEFMQIYPGVTLEVVFNNDIADLLEGEVDFAMRVMAEPPLNLVARNMGPVHYVACAAPALVQQHGMPGSLADLHQVPLITSNLTGQKLRLAGHHLGGTELRIKPRLMSANFYFLRDAILQGLGVGVVPDYMVREPLQRGDLVQLPFAPGSLDFLSTHKYLLYMPTRFQTRAIATLIDFLLAKAAQQGAG